MSEGRDWVVEDKFSAVEISIEDCSYGVQDEGLAAIAHAILLLQDTLVNESENNRDADDERYEDARDRYSRLDEKRKDLEEAIKEIMNSPCIGPWTDPQKISPMIEVIVKMEDGQELKAYHTKGKFLSPHGIEYENVKSWRYPECKSE